MKPRLSYLGAELARIKGDNLRRSLRYGTISGPYITIRGKRLLNLCSNDYLGIPATRLGRAQVQSSSRLVSGNDDSYLELEKSLARHKSQHSALVYPTGYMANLGTIAAVAGRGDVIFSDELNHASIIEACSLSGASTVIYGHNDTEDLARKISKVGGRRFIVTEGVFSMDGDLARLDEIVEIAQKNDAITVLDDAHGDFVMGRDGRGTPDRFRVSREIDIYTSSLSKGLGSFGGYVASEKSVTDYCINRSRPFIYTSALPSVFVNHALARLKSDRKPRRKRLAANTQAMTSGLRKIGYDITFESQIIPIIIGDEKTAMSFGRYLVSQGIFAQPIRYPTVARGSARVRISITAWITRPQVQVALDAFEKAGKKFGII